MSIHVEAAKSKEEILFQLIQLVDSPKTGYIIDEKQTINLAKIVLSTYSLGAFGRFKSGLFWCLNKVVCSKTIKNWIEVQRAISIAYSAIKKNKDIEFTGSLFLLPKKLKQD